MDLLFWDSTSSRVDLISIELNHVYYFLISDYSLLYNRIGNNRCIEQTHNRTIIQGLFLNGSGS